MSDKSLKSARKPKPVNRTRPLAGKDRKQQDRRKFIQHEAGLLFSEFGYAAATMDQLSERTGLNKSTLYYYYTSKSDILFDFCVTSGAGKATQMIKASLKMEKAVDGLEHFTQVMVAWILEHRYEVRVYFKEWEHFEQIFDAEQFKVAREQRLAFTNTLTKLIEKGIKTKEFKVEDPVNSSRFIIGSIIWIYQWISEDENADALVEQLMSFIKNGLKVEHT